MQQGTAADGRHRENCDQALHLQQHACKCIGADKTSSLVACLTAAQVPWTPQTACCCMHIAPTHRTPTGLAGNMVPEVLYSHLQTWPGS